MCQARLAGVQKKLDGRRSEYLEHLETTLMTKLNHLWHLEDVFWRQKAKCQWLRGGERNTRYFHTTVVLRKKRKLVEQLRGDNGAWCDDPTVLEQWVVSFYEKLYASEGGQHCDPTYWSFPNITHDNHWWLNRDVSDGEIRLALSQMGPDKAARPDGFIPRFSQ